MSKIEILVDVLLVLLLLVAVTMYSEEANATELSYTPYVYHTSITYRSELNEKVNMIGIEHNNVIATVFTNSFNDRGYGLGLKLPLPEHPGKTKIGIYVMGLFGYKDSLIKPYAQLSFKKHFRKGLGGSLNWGTGLVSASLLYKF